MAQTSESNAAETSARLYFADLNHRLGKLGFRLWETHMEDPLNKRGFHHCEGHLWPIQGKMLQPVWKLVRGKNVRQNPRYFEVAATRKDDFAAHCIRIATENIGALVANDGHPSNDPAHWDRGRFTK